MPYIPKARREEIVAGDLPETAGELNFLISDAIDSYIGSYFAQGEGSYDTLNTVIGVLECAKLELYSRVVALYETARLQENGDVYHCVWELK